MKRLIIISILCFLSVFAKGQVYQLMPQYGYDAKRMNFDSTLSIPSFCGTPSLLSNKTKKAAIAFDSCNNRFYYYNPKLFTWDTIRTGTPVDTNRFVKYVDTSAMLNPYLRKTDTTNRFVNAVVKINDSTFRVYKGSTSTDISIGLVTSATRLITEVWNNTGSTITRGSVVYISGRHSSNLPTIAVAEANNENNSYKTFALVSQDISDNSRGYVIQAGKISGLNLPTSSYTDGDILYLSPTVPGGYTTTKPLAPYHIVKLGSVTRAHPTQGSIEIKIENGWQLDELSDVQIPAVPNDSALLQFSRVDSLWHSVSPSTAIGNRYIRPSDTTAMLSPYLRSNIAAATYATISQNNTKLNISDTSAMLSPYARTNAVNAGLALKLNISDTATMLTNYARTNLVNTKLNISDTATMLSPYARTNFVNATFTTSVFRKTASDSVFFVRGGNNVFAFRDSLGGGSAANPTASVGLTAVNGSASTFMRSDAAPALDQSIAPTWTGLHTFSRSVTASGGVARGTFMTPALTAAANNDVLVGLDVAPTFTNGAFTGVSNLGLRIAGGTIAGNNGAQIGLRYNDGGLAIIGMQGGGWGALGFWGNGRYTATSTPDFRIFGNGGVRASNNLVVDGNTLLGTATDAGFRLDVNGTARVQGNLTFGSSTSYLFGDANNIRLYDKNNSIILQSFPSGVSNSETYLQNAGGLNKFTMRSDYAGIFVSDGITSNTNAESFIVKRGFFGNVLTGDKNVLKIQSQLYSNITNGSLQRGIYVALDNSSFTGFTNVRAIETTIGNTLLGTTSGSVGIGANTSINASAILDVTSTTQGFLPPRMTTTQRDAIATPAAGLIIYNTTTNKHQGYNGTTWNDFY